MNSILLIEDDVRFAEAFKAYAKRICSVEVVSVPSMLEAFAMLKLAEFSAIALDLTLTDSEPRQTIAAIHRLDQFAPVIIVTGATGDAAGIMRNLSVINGAAAFIQKDHIGMGGWALAISIMLDAYLRRRALKLKTDQAA